jgi:hypothetical protein
MEKFSHLWQYLADFCFAKEMFQINVLQKTKMQFMFSDYFPRTLTVYEIMSNIWYNREDADNMTPARGVLDN